MSSPSYVYIPNLVGRQMLRIPMLPSCCDDDFMTTPSPPSLTLDTTSPSTTHRPSYSRDTASPAPSVESVDELE